ncbi:MAG: iron-containing alcohol dehydrogenase family protein [Peptococcaceae bacterium]
MFKKIIAPGIYQRQQGIRHSAGEYCKELGTKAYVIGGKTALKVIEKDLLKSFQNVKITAVRISWYGGEVSWDNIHKLAREAQSLNCDFIIGIGGGKALDTAKAAAFQANLPLVTMPTIAATCAAWTPLSIIYTNEGEYLELSLKAQNPGLVLVDSEIIVQAPLELFRAGIGDTLAKWFELEITVRKNRKDAAVAAACSLAYLCYQNLIKYGPDAVEDLKKALVTPAVEEIIDANIMLSGLVSGLGGDDFRSGGAHAVYNGFTVLPETHHYFHGSIVAFGILCQLILDSKEKEVLELLPFYKEVGLPYLLEQIGVNDLTPAKALAVGKAAAATEDMANLPLTITPEMVTRAIRKTDSMGRGQVNDYV